MKLGLITFQIGKLIFMDIKFSPTNLIRKKLCLYPYYKVCGLNENSGQTDKRMSLLPFTEILTENLSVLRDYGLAFTILKLRQFVQQNLNSKSRNKACFKENVR